MTDLFEITQEIDPISPEGEEAIQTVASETRELTRLPPVALKILQLADDPNSTAQDMERVVSKDPASVALLLKIANSSFYGLSRKVESLQRAILIIGFKTIRDLLVASSVLSEVFKPTDKHARALCERAVGAAIASRILSLEYEDGNADEAFISGMLHDLGMAVMYQKYKDDYQPVLYGSRPYPSKVTEFEKERFGFTHTQLGGRLARQWRFSETVEGLIRYHHHFAEMDWTEAPHLFKVCLAITALADKYCDFLGIGCEENQEMDFQSPIGSREAEFLGLEEDALMRFVQEIQVAYIAESAIFLDPVLNKD